MTTMLATERPEKETVPQPASPPPAARRQKKTTDATVSAVPSGVSKRYTQFSKSFVRNPAQLRTVPRVSRPASRPVAVTRPPPAAPVSTPPVEDHPTAEKMKISADPPPAPEPAPASSPAPEPSCVDDPMSAAHDPIPVTDDPAPEADAATEKRSRKHSKKGDKKAPKHPPK